MAWGAVGVGLGLIADGLEAGDAVLEGRVVQVGDAVFDGVVEALEPGSVSAARLFSSAMWSRRRSVRSWRRSSTEARISSSRSGWSSRSSRWLGDKVVELFHRDRAAFAAGLALPGLGGAGVVTIAPALAGAERHGAAAVGAEADAGKQRGPADDGEGVTLGLRA